MFAASLARPTDFTLTQELRLVRPSEGTSVTIPSFVLRRPWPVFQGWTHGVGHRRDKALADPFEVGSELTQKIGIRPRGQLIGFVVGVGLVCDIGLNDGRLPMPQHITRRHHRPPPRSGHSPFIIRRLGGVIGTERIERDSGRDLAVGLDQAVMTGTPLARTPRGRYAALGV